MDCGEPLPFHNAPSALMTPAIPVSSSFWISSVILRVILNFLKMGADSGSIPLYCCLSFFFANEMDSKSER